MGSRSDHDVMDRDPRAIYFEQMENGMFVRMALLVKVSAGSLRLMPLIKIHGMIDPHTHLRDLDWAHKATFASPKPKPPSPAAFWAVFDMPNTAPSTIDQNRLLLDKAQAHRRRRPIAIGVSTSAPPKPITPQNTRSIARQVCGLEDLQQLDHRRPAHQTPAPCGNATIAPGRPTG